MTTGTTMATARYDAADVLADLLRREHGGVFHFMAEADPYIDRAAAELRRPLQGMIVASQRREGEVTGLLMELGSTPKPPPVSPERQYMAFLTIEYLLPKLVEDKKRSIGQYEQALRMVEGINSEVGEMLKAHLDELREELGVLEREGEALKKKG